MLSQLEPWMVEALVGSVMAQLVHTLASPGLVMEASKALLQFVVLCYRCMHTLLGS